MKTLNELRLIAEEEIRNVRNLAKFKAQKSSQEFERLIAPWVRNWDEFIPQLRQAKMILPADQQNELESLIRAFNEAAGNLSLYLRARRLELKKK